MRTPSCFFPIASHLNLIQLPMHRHHRHSFVVPTNALIIIMTVMVAATMRTVHERNHRTVVPKIQHHYGKSSSYSRVMNMQETFKSVRVNLCIYTGERLKHNNFNGPPVSGLAQ